MSKPWFRRKKFAKPYTGNDPSDVLKSNNHGYIGFRLYFPDDSGLDVDLIKSHVNLFICYFEQYQSSYSIDDIVKDKYFTLDYKILIESDDILLKWPEFSNELIENTEYCVKCMGLAMHHIITNYYAKENMDNPIESDEVIARVANVEPIIQIQDLNVNYFEKLVTIRGTVIKASQEKLINEYLTFVCSNCTGTQIIKQQDNLYTTPIKCKTKDCTSKSNFSVLCNSVMNRIIDRQSIKIQEVLWQTNGRTPRTLNCILTGDLLKSCSTGDDIKITGIIKKSIDLTNNRSKENSIFNLYLDATFVIKQGKCDSLSRSGVIFTQNDYREICKIHESVNIFSLLVNSLCPNIYGHEIVKAGLLLSLFGGTKSEKFRAEPHILLVGDPGLGKSQMLQACANVAVRGVYVCGNTSTSSGLTVTMTRDGGDYALEAGALMLSDQGVCCIDEFDKMPNQHASLLEVMEQQTISIAKAGIVCTLPTRSAVLAAANPVGGHYNKSKTVAENLKISSPMLSRFDLIFILLDKPNEEVDLLLSKHVLGQHSINMQKSKIFDRTVDSSTSNKTLRDRLQMDLTNGNLLSHEMFRKYVAYAQKYVKPALSDEAKKVLKDFYMELRRQFQIGDCTPVTTRQANSLKRLTQARAKLELRELATKEDALDVIEIMKTSLQDIFTDNAGVLDKTRSQNSTGTSTKSQSTKLLGLLSRQSEIDSKSIFTTKELKEIAERAGIPTDKFYTILDNVNLQGFLLKKGQGRYQLVTADY